MASSSSKKETSEKLTKKFRQLRSNALEKGLNSKKLRRALEVSTQTTQPKLEKRWHRKVYTFLLAYRVHMLVLMVAVIFGVLITTFATHWGEIRHTQCLIPTNDVTEEIFRPRTDCNMCRDVYHVPEERNLSVDDFYHKYSFTGRPVLVKEATANWTAMSHFSFQYFRKLYQEAKDPLEAAEPQSECQFFPYNTEFKNLAHALDMPEERASFQAGQPSWYFGWSNCHIGVGQKLREHYERPYFLPPDSEAVSEDWIFMGGSGPGANVHLDYVVRPSWQAQISGTKTWQLIPSPECESVCHAFNVTVEKGDIIVLDTNIWYHATFVHPGEISITIGSEYD